MDYVARGLVQHFEKAEGRCRGVVGCEPIVGGELIEETAEVEGVTWTV
jgi:hypothetical protein